MNRNGKKSTINYGKCVFLWIKTRFMPLVFGKMTKNKRCKQKMLVEIISNPVKMVLTRIYTTEGRDV